MGEIVKSRKAQKKQKEKELLEDYEKSQISNEYILSEPGMEILCSCQKV